jgi:uncharacterized UPF0160 family protein
MAEPEKEVNQIKAYLDLTGEAIGRSGQKITIEDKDFTKLTDLFNNLNNATKSKNDKLQKKFKIFLRKKIDDLNEQFNKIVDDNLEKLKAENEELKKNLKINS